MPITGITIEHDSVVITGVDFDALCAMAAENEQLRKALSARLQELEQLKQSCEGLALLAFPRMAREAVPGDI